MTKDIINDIRQLLHQNIDEGTKLSSQRFFKEEVMLYGVKTETVTKIAKQGWKEVKPLPKPTIFQLCESLWCSGYLEESFIACHWSYALRDFYEPQDFAMFEHWVQHYVTNWAACDTLCNHTIGAFIEKFPEALSALKDWTARDNRWMKRAAAVTLIIPARHGKFLEQIFEIADRLLLDRDDMVQKGYGWLLKAASEAHQQEVFDYVIKHRHEMPRTALRYAIEKMSKEMRAQAMQKS